jgi:hypothetical protein
MTDKLTEIVQDLKRPLTLEEYEEFLKNWK